RGEGGGGGGGGGGAGGGDGGRGGGEPASPDGAGIEFRRRQGRRQRRGVGGGRDLPEGVSDRAGRTERSRRRAISEHQRPSVGRLLEPGGSARRAGAAPSGAPRRGGEVKTAAVILAI